MGCVRISLLALLLSASLSAQSRLVPTIGGDGVVGSADYSSGMRPGIPRGSLFTIFGRDLAPAQARADRLPLPTVLNGVRVRIWASAAAGGAFAEAPLVYVSPQQINALLPSSVGEGVKAVTVQVDGVDSAASQFTVIGARFAAFAQAGLGFGPAVLQQYDQSGHVSLNGFLNPAQPGQAMVLWGTGLGPGPEQFAAGSARPLLPAVAGADQRTPERHPDVVEFLRGRRLQERIRVAEGGPGVA